jgi:hypothetical protein
MKNASVRQPLSMEPLLFPLSSRAKPRDLQFSGPLVETPTFILKQIFMSTAGVMGLPPTKVIKNASVRRPLFMEPLSFPLSSRPERRDLRFRGPFVETPTSIHKQNCHLDRSEA